ncbi:MAG TPA: sulfite exporter TauE/SafE family protein [Streptosporangiaceae bacterium]|nr:sulfite exporter TauE/SafE family protein [Streptosporangiaceae bacterium]
MTLIAIAAGLLIGLSLGALGGGGSILTVPALVYLLGQSAHQATTASLLVVGIAAVVGAIVHARAGRVRLRAGAVFGLLGIAGSYAGSLASAAVPAGVLLAGFGLLMLAVAAVMFLRRGGPGPARRAASGGSAASAGSGGSGTGAASGGRHAVLVAAAATGVGLITGFFGVGGGFVVVPALVLVLGFDMATAAGTSLVVIAVNSAVALAVRAGHGGLSLDWALVAVFTVAAAAGALAGGRVAGRVSPRRLTAAFTVLVVLVGGYTLARSLPALVQ